MDDRTNDILRAAQAMFSRYGFAKTTMSDIAAQAGVARQTVYNAFPGKVEILRAVVRMSGKDTLATVRDTWSNQDDFADKLDAFHEHVPVKWYEAMRASPDWGELMDGVHNAAAEELEAIGRTWLAELQAMFAAHKELDFRTDELADVVEFFYATSLNAKYGAADIAQLRRRLSVIKRATMALVGAD